jgi:hypothetical protein
MNLYKLFCDACNKNNDHLDLINSCSIFVLSVKFLLSF